MKLRAHRGAPLQGMATLPGDKSLSHRALIMAALAVGESRIEGLLPSADIAATAAALQACGARIEAQADGATLVQGVGIGGLREPEQVLYLGNAGTSARLLLGVLAGQPFTSFLTGDPSLRRRPMARVCEPLQAMGARLLCRSGTRLPLAITGSTALLPLEYRLPVASAQVKSAILLAGLHAAGQTTVIEPEPCRDHTERLLRHLGAGLTIETLADGARAITLTGQPELGASHYVIPGDPSSAAFPLIAAALCPGSRIRLPGVGVNPLRTGLLDCLAEMGAGLAFADQAEVNGEPVATLTLAAGEGLQAITVPPARVPAMIDEFPILAVAAACAAGTSRFTNLAELRVKESDRLRAIARGLEACGAALEMGEDWLTIHGTGTPPAGGAEIDAQHDHRIAMSFLVLGLVARQPVTVRGAETIATSFPGFRELMTGLGAQIEVLA